MSAEATSDVAALEAALREQLKGIPKKRLVELTRNARRLQRKLALEGPQTDEELHRWIVDELGIVVPRTAVCEGHCSPFEFLADCYFERTMNALAMANRGGSKTFLVAMLHLMNSQWKPGVESVTVGAVEQQARRAYMHMGKLISKLDGGEQRIRKQTQQDTEWINGSRVEILPGTMNAVNGPHPQKLHLDEVELMDPEVYDEAMPVDTDVITPHGRVKLGDLAIGDVVTGVDGMPTRVTKVNDLGLRDVYRFELSDGREAVSCMRHVWQVRRRDGSWRDVRTQDIVDDYARDEWGGSGHRHYLRPLEGPVEVFNDSELPIDPYVLGAMLGDSGNVSTMFRNIDVGVPTRTFAPSIVDVSYAGRAVCRCIGVDSAEKMFVVGDYLPTHNSMNMPTSREIEGTGRVVRAQVIKTSTRKRGHGMMQQFVDEIEDARVKGHTPPSTLYCWCAFEVAKRVPNCQAANPTCENPCDCANVVKGKWENGSDRTLRDVCGGRLAKSDGWIPYSDIVRTFQDVSRPVWEAQQECSKPSTEGLVVPQFARERHCLVTWDPDPSLGPIFTSVDFGGTNPHAVCWFQLLKYDVDAKNAYDAPVRVREGSLVVFDEVYRSGIGNVALARMVHRREDAWRQRHRHFRVRMRTYDQQAKAAKLDWANHERPLKLIFLATKDVKEHVKLCVDWVDDDKFFVAGDRCNNFVEEIEAWHYPRKRPGMQDDPEVPVDDFDHAMSAWRYMLANLNALARRGQRVSTTPRTAKHGHVTKLATLPDTKHSVRSADGRTVMPVGVRRGG